MIDFIVTPRVTVVETVGWGRRSNGQVGGPPDGRRAGGDAAWPAAGQVLTKEVREHDFVGEEGGPLKGGGAVGIGAAEEFVLAIGLANQLGVAKLAADPAAAALGKEVFEFHTPPR